VDLAPSSPLLPPSAAPLILVAFFLLSALALWALYRRWQQKALPHSPVRESAEGAPLLELVGGARMLLNYSIPFARLSLWERGISLSAPGANASLAWPEINRAVLIKPFVPVGSGVEFQASKCSPIIYWGRKGVCLQVLDICEQHGVQVERKARMRL
jgi:hypothetical protein